jgi:hypothetical protein
VSTSKKIKAGTQNLLIPKGAPTSSITTASQPLANPVPSQSTGLFKKSGAKIVLMVGCVSVLLGVMYCKYICKNENQNALYLQAWGVDRLYCKAFVSMTNALAGVEALTTEAQALITTQQEQLSAKKVMNSSDRQACEALEGYQTKFKKRFKEAVIIRNQAEFAKLDPVSQKNMDAQGLEYLKLILEKQRESALAMLAKEEEIKSLLAEMKIQCAKTAAASIAAQKIQPPKFVKELAKGSGVDFTVVQFMAIKEIHDVRMNEKDIFILAVWSPQPEVECGAEVKTLALTRREGGRAYIAGPEKKAQLGPASLMGLSTLSQFPTIDAIADSCVGSKSNEWVVASMPNIKFTKSLTKDELLYQVTGVPESQAGEKRLYASAFVFEPKMRGSFSLDGQMTLQAPNNTAKVSWMIWIARFD